MTFSLLRHLSPLYTGSPGSEDTNRPVWETKKLIPDSINFSVDHFTKSEVTPDTVSSGSRRWECHFTTLRRTYSCYESYQSELTHSDDLLYQRFAWLPFFSFITYDISKRFRLFSYIINNCTNMSSTLVWNHLYSLFTYVLVKIKTYS